MPLPRPRKKEKQKAFHGRCMADPVMVSEYPDEKQRNAVCYAQWEERDMAEFMGFDDWIEIFRGGKQTDSMGIEHDGDDLIDKAVARFDPASHEPPAVIGHPKDNAPAFGWVEDLKMTVNDGVKVLLAKFKQVVPEFEELAKKGVYKKRSAAFYPDGRLRHVGFLGAAPPAVKGLADLKFNDDGDSIEFVGAFAEVRPWTWSAIAGVFRKLREYFIEKEGAEKANDIIPEWDIEDIREEGRRAEETEPEAGSDITPNFKKGETVMNFKDFLEAFRFWKQVEKDPDADLSAIAEPGGRGTGKGAFTEADLEKAKQEAEAEGRQKAEAEFNEKGSQEASEARAKEIAAWVDQWVKEGKIPPAWRDRGLTAFMQGLQAENEIAFAEGGEKKSPQAWFREFLNSFAENPIFREIATKDGTGAEFSEAKKEQELGESIAAKVNG